MFSFSPEGLILLGTIVTALSTLIATAVTKYLDWRKTDRQADLQEPKIVAEARISTVTSFANELGINREMFVQLMSRDVDIAKLSGQVVKQGAVIARLEVKQAQSDERIKALETENQHLKLGQFHSDARIKASDARIELLETENKALESRLVISDKRIEDLETDNKELRRQLEIERTRNLSQQALSTNEHDAAKISSTAITTVTIDTVVS